MPDTRRVAIALRIDEPHPNHQEVFGGVRRFAREHPHWQCVIDEYPGFSDPSRSGPDERYDGVITRAVVPRQRRLRRRGIPFVNTMYYSANPSAAGVYLDVRLCGRLAAEHLLERGFRRLMYLDLGIYAQARDIGQHFVKTAEDYSCACTFVQLKPGRYEDRRYWMYLRRQMAQLLDRLTPPVGFLVALPWTARLLLAMCEAHGWHVPQQAAMISVDNMRNIVEMPPQISCIDCNYEQIGFEAAALLEDIMNGTSEPDKQVLVPPRGIITRESTDYYAVEDEVVAEALRFISTRLREKLNLDVVADAVSVSPRSLQRRFDQAMNRSLSQEIRRLRLELAKRLLGDPDMPIGQVAATAGFGSSVILSQVVRKELNMTPSAYRRQALQANRRR